MRMYVYILLFYLTTLVVFAYAAGYVLGPFGVAAGLFTGHYGARYLLGKI